MDSEKKNTILITCGRGLSPYLQQETERLGYQIDSTHETGLQISATLADTFRLNVNLRTAFNVLYLLKEFKCTDPRELYENVFALEWETIIPADEYISIVSSVNTASVNNSVFASQKVKDAIVDRMVKKVSKRPNSGPERDNIVINLYWKDDRCWLYLNTSGRKLSDRNYRKIPHKAPMQETLAAGVILSTGYTGEGALVNPMCGSGTLAIEAALIALKRPPGILRNNFGFMHLKNFNRHAWEALRQEALNNSKKSLAFPIIATDSDEKAIEAAKKNALTAGLSHLIEFSVCDFFDTPIPKEKGIVILNPEYGERLGEVSQLEKTYERIGDFFKQKCAGFRGYVFSGNTPLLKKVGLKPQAKIPFYNAQIECRLYEYPLYEGSRQNKQQ